MSKFIFTDRIYPCPICPKKFKANHHLREHMSLHSDSPNFKCNKCQMEFKAPGAWRNHIRKKHGFECSVCKKLFSTMTNLRSHRMKSGHDNPKNRIEDEAKIEKGVDSNENQIIKPRNVAKKTQKPKSVVKKILEKSRRNKVKSNKIGKTAAMKCNYCGMKFTLSRSLRRHINTNHSESYKHTCKLCGHQTNRSDNYKVHMSRHEEGVSISCTYASCEKVFFATKCLKIHLRSVHGGDIVKRDLRNGDKRNVNHEEMDNDNSVENEEESISDNGDEAATLSNGNFDEDSLLIPIDKVKSSKVVRSAEKPKISTQLKISKFFSLNSKKDEEEKLQTENNKVADNSVQYECCECKIYFSSNSELWKHLMAKHSNKFKSNGKK